MFADLFSELKSGSVDPGDASASRSAPGQSSHDSGLWGVVVRQGKYGPGEVAEVIMDWARSS